MNKKMRSTEATAKDFFLYLAFAVTLIWLIASIFIFSFQLVDLLVPDTLDRGYYGGGVPMLTGAMASLITVTPFFLVIATLINRDLKQNEGKREMWVRKWLLYAVLFLSFIVALGDLVMILGSFLQGELTQRFVWKSLVVLLVSLAVFGYYFYDLRRDSEKLQRIPLYAGIALGVVATILVVAGFVVAGTPAEQRAERLDVQRVSDLQTIVWNIETYVNDNGSLPQSLEDIEFIQDSDLTDPETGDFYEYSVTGEDEFMLCAVFALPTNDSRTSHLGDEWEHDAGRECFSRRVTEREAADGAPQLEKRLRLEAIPVDN